MSDRTWHWEIRVVGEPSDVAHVVAHLLRPGFSLRRDGEYWWLRTDRADALHDASEAFDAARLELAAISGVLKVSLGSSNPLEPRGIVKIHADGQRDYSLVVTRGLRLLGRLSDDGGAELRRLADRDHIVAKALRLLVASDAEFWTGIYRLFELIEGDVGGEAGSLALGWASKAERSRFKHSANSIAVGGDLARHGFDRKQPPRDPMPMEEARSLVTSLLQAWFSSKR